MTQILVILAYVAAIVLANLTIVWFGPAAAPVNAFFLIGFTLVARDVLHEAWTGRNRPARMIALIIGAGLISYFINPDAGRIALASLGAFVLSETVDWIAYARLDKHPWMIRSNGSNVFGAITDSLAFPVLAFGVIPGIGWVMLGQVAGKWLGGFVWSLVLKYAYDPDKRRLERQARV